MKLFILLVDDEPEVLDQLAQTLPDRLDDYDLIWDPCPSFDEGLQRLESRRYDVVVTDMVLRTKASTVLDNRGMKTIEEIRGKRFCPIIAYSSRAKPEELFEGVFLKFADKAKGNDDIVAKLIEVLASGVPSIARRLHDELDGIGGKYLWDFLAKNWEELTLIESTTPVSLERLVRRRAATQLARLTGEKEIEDVGSSEFYIHPKISGTELRLGEILKRKNSDEYRVVLTPHCHLKVQAGETESRADYVLTVRTVLAQNEIEKAWVKKRVQFKKTLEGRTEAARRFTGANPDLGNPKGRFWFMPRFLKMPDLYCDFMQVESLPFKSLTEDYDHVAVLDTPFAEALQGRFAEFYSAIGTANLKSSEFVRLIPVEAAEATHG